MPSPSTRDAGVMAVGVCFAYEAKSRTAAKPQPGHHRIGHYVDVLVNAPGLESRH